MKKNENYNPYGLHEKEPLFKKIAFWSIFGASLAGLVFFLALQMLRANSAPTFVYYLVYYLSEVVSTGSLFALLALGAVSIAREEEGLRRKLLRREAAALFGISFAAKLFLYWLTALLDAKLVLPFYFNNVTLSYLTASGGFRFIMSALSSLVNLTLTFLMLYVAFRLVRNAYLRGGKRGSLLPAMKKIPVFVYLTVALLSAVINTILTILDYGISASPGVLITLAMPYVAIAAYALLGQFFLNRLTDLFATEA